MNQSLTQQMVDDAMARNQAGETIRTIATEYSIPRSTLRLRLDKVGYTTAGNYKTAKRVEDEVFRLSLCRLTQSEICSKTGLSQSTVWGICKRLGVTTWRPPAPIPHISTLKMSICHRCGEILKSAIIYRKHCNECQYLAQLERDAAMSAQRRASTIKTCPECGESFFPEKSLGQTYCSHRCSKRVGRRNHNHKRRALTRGGDNIILKTLYDRDHGLCAICGGPVPWVDPAGKQYHPANPTIDHVIPLSKGGPHEWGNVQLAHGMCNSIKCDGELAIAC